MKAIELMDATDRRGAAAMSEEVVIGGVDEIQTTIPLEIIQPALSQGESEAFATPSPPIKKFKGKGKV